MASQPDTAGIFHVRTDMRAPRHAASSRWPWAGQKLTPALREQMGLPEGELPNRIVISGHQDYRVAENGYLLPYYPVMSAAEDNSSPDIARRNEQLIVSRARSFIANAQNDLGVPRSKADIQQAIGEFLYMPESSYMECARKAGKFKILVGAIVTRFEMLGRAISQGNTEGTQIESDETSTLTPERIHQMKSEFAELYVFLGNDQIEPLLRTVLLDDKTLDRDGILIDLIREIGKPLSARYPDAEANVRDAIITKIGNAMESIDQVHDRLVAAITQEPTGELFKGAIQKFIQESGDRFEIHNVDDVVHHLDQYAELCKARAGMRSSDRKGYDEVFSQKSALDGLFNSPNGLLESMRRAGRHGSSKEVQEMRSILSRGVKMMARTASSRIACNEAAPEIWMPNLDMSASASPMDRFLAARFIPDTDRKRYEQIFEQSNTLPEKDEIGNNPRLLFLKKSFCSLGILEADLQELGQNIKAHHDAASAKESEKQVVHHVVPVPTPMKSAAAAVRPTSRVARTSIQHGDKLTNDEGRGRGKSGQQS